MRTTGGVLPTAMTTVERASKPCGSRTVNSTGNRPVSLKTCVAVAPVAPVAEPVEWKIGGDTFSGYLVYDDSITTPRPGLVMVPNWKGVNDSAIEKAHLVAGDDYVVLVADVYGKGVRPRTDAEAGPVATAMRHNAIRASANRRSARVEILGRCVLMRLLIQDADIGHVERHQRMRRRSAEADRQRGRGVGAGQIDH